LIQRLDAPIPADPVGQAGRAGLRAMRVACQFRGFPVVVEVTIPGRGEPCSTCTPANPGAQLVTTARNRAINRIRRDRTLAAKTRLLRVPRAARNRWTPRTSPTSGSSSSHPARGSQQGRARLPPRLSGPPHGLRRHLPADRHAPCPRLARPLGQRTVHRWPVDRDAGNRVRPTPRSIPSPGTQKQRPKQVP
jgi:hypothetical protein